VVVPAKEENCDGKDDDCDGIIDNNNCVITFAGTGLPGLKNGHRLDARFNLPSDLVFDSSGILFVADSENNVVRKIDPKGVVSTFSGSGLMGHTDGPKEKASYTRPGRIAINLQNNKLYLSDRSGSVKDVRLREIDKNGLSDSLPRAPLDYFELRGIAVDSKGSVFIEQNAQVFQLSGSQWNHIAGSEVSNGNADWQDGSALHVFFGGIDSMFFIPSGELIIMNSHHGVIVSLSADKKTASALVGQKGSSWAFTYIGHAVYDPKRKMFYTVDERKILQIDQAMQVKHIGGTGVEGFEDGPAMKAKFLSPHGMAIDTRGDLYIVDTGNNRIRKFVFK
jgi:DNA-binding beta-propeller fold protein YncE